MRPFQELCRTAEQLSAEEYAGIVVEKSAKILPALHALTGNAVDATSIFASFLIASVYADGKLDETEYAALLPVLRLCFGDEFDYDAAKAVVREFSPEGKEMKKLVDEMVDFLGMLSDELKDDIVILSLLVCAIDGKVSLREKLYIKQLMR